MTSHFETLTTKVVATTEITPTSTEPEAIATSSTLFSTASPTVSQSSKVNATERSRQYESRMQDLNVSREDSLQEAATISNTFFEDLKNDPPEDNGINILVATQQLDMFAISFLLFVAMKVQQIRPNDKEAISFSLNETDFRERETGIARISIPLAVFEGREDAVIVSILYNGIEEWIPSIGNVRLENGATISNPTLGSRIVSSTVHPKPNGTLKENVTVVFSCNIDAEEEVTPHCVFWDFMLKSDVKGYWSKRGCSLVKKKDNEITCSCNHLTNFAVLMQIGSNKVPSGHKDALEVITYVGCALSLAGEALAIVAYWIFMNLKEEQIQIRFNLVVAIAIAQITFLAGVEASALQGLCIFVAGLIHYFYLVAFAWMLFEGVYLYLMVVKVFNTEIKMRLFYVVAWGLPLLIVLLSMLIASTQDGGIHGYVHGEFCWVSFTNNLIWTFVTPVLVVCSINTVLLGRVINEIVKMQSGNTSEVEKVRKGVKACAVLFPLLGLTWVFGILSVTDAGLVFQYIFTILNSLQGLLIFILHVLRNADVRAAYFRKKKNWKSARSIGTSHTANHDSIALGSSNTRSEGQDSRSKSYCTSPRSERSVIGSDKPFAFDHDRCMTPVDT
ncbi:unnamed protein product [Porites evermanni]|uniref:Adhesion G-protein coupled receptor D1-like n=1 Tax=Porites evermanni TaxID=104178 RepID=A0ABN8LZY1_9CNID|nr:unnamed protein product [Porites evermanni]